LVCEAAWLELYDITATELAVHECVSSETHLQPFHKICETAMKQNRDVKMCSSRHNIDNIDHGRKRSMKLRKCRSMSTFATEIVNSRLEKISCRAEKIVDEYLHLTVRDGKCDHTSA